MFDLNDHPEKGSESKQEKYYKEYKKVCETAYRIDV